MALVVLINLLKSNMGSVVHCGYQ